MFDLPFPGFDEGSVLERMLEEQDPVDLALIMTEKTEDLKTYFTGYLIQLNLLSYAERLIGADICGSDYSLCTAGSIANDDDYQASLDQTYKKMVEECDVPDFNLTLPDYNPLPYWQSTSGNRLRQEVDQWMEDPVTKLKPCQLFRDIIDEYVQILVASEELAASKSHRDTSTPLPDTRRVLNK